MQPSDRTFYSLSSETLENTDFFHLLHSNNLNCNLKNRDISCGATVSQLVCPGDTNFYMNRYTKVIQGRQAIETAHFVILTIKSNG